MNPAVKQITFLGVLLAVPVSSYFLVFQPQNDAIEAAERTIKERQTSLERLRAATAQSADLEKANTEMHEAISNLENRLPSGKDLDSVLSNVADIAAGEGLELQQFKKLTKVIQAGLATEQPLELKIRGDFDAFYRFLLRLEQLPRITRLTDMKLLRDDGSDGHVSVTCTLSIYYQPETTTAAASARDQGATR